MTRPLACLLVVLALLPAVAFAAPSFVEADRAFDRGDLAGAERLYEALAGGAPLDSARALEGLAAVYLSTGRDDRFRATMAEVVSLRRSLPSPAAAAGGDLVAEGGFERGLVPPWGTGHYESGNFNFGIWWNSGTGRSFAKMDSAVTHAGQASLRLTNFSPAAPHVFGTTAQRIRPVAPNSLYELTVWARAADLKPGAVRFVMDAGWHVSPLALPPGTYDWMPLRAQFNSGDLAFIDLRILFVDTGTVWLDEVSLRRLGEQEAATDPLVAADAEFRKGSVLRALERYEDLERRWAGNPRLPAVYLKMAEVLTALGEYGRAMAFYEKLRTPTNLRIWMAAGDIYLNLGQPDKALEQYRHAYDRSMGDQALRAQTADRMAMACLRLGRVQEAAAYEGEALHVMTHINDPHGRGLGMCHLGQIYLRAGEFPAARQAFEAAMPLARATGDRKLESDVLTYGAVVAGQGKDLEAAVRGLEEAVRLRREVHDRYGLIYSLYWLGRFRHQQGDRPRARQALEEAVDLLEGVKDASGSIERAGETLLQGNAEIYEELIRLNLEESRTEDALAVLSRSRNQALRRLFEGAALGPEETRLVARARGLQGEQEALERRLQQELSRPAGQQDRAVVESSRQERETKLRQYREFLRDLFQTHPELAGLISVHPKQLKLKQKSLPEDAAILEFLCGETQLYLFLVTPRTLDVRIADLPRADLTRRVASLRRRIANGAGAQGPDPALLQESHALYRDLLAPVASDLQGVRTLAILPNGPLHYLPFQALVTDPAIPEFVVDRMACLNMCEESFLAPAGTRGAPSRLLLLGNPDGSLVYAEEEVRRIVDLFPGSQAYVGSGARKELVASAAGEYQGLHLATHGILDSRDAAASYIVLAPDAANPAAGRLTLREVWGLDLDGLELVTLSACRTALGEGNPGDDLISLENAFLFAGAASVVASLWDVDDAATARLMAEFYANLKTTPRARALQQAQLSVKSRLPHPYYWAPFILVGPAE